MSLESEGSGSKPHESCYCHSAMTTPNGLRRRTLFAVWSGLFSGRLPPIGYRSVSEKRWEGILQGYVDCFDLDLSAMISGSTKSPTFAVQHPNMSAGWFTRCGCFTTVSMTSSACFRKALSRKKPKPRGGRRLDTLFFQRVRKIFALDTNRRCGCST